MDYLFVSVSFEYLNDNKKPQETTTNYEALVVKKMSAAI